LSITSIFDCDDISQIVAQKWAGWGYRGLIATRKYQPNLLKPDYNPMSYRQIRTIGLI
jgi:hypothetical protein